MTRAHPWRFRQPAVFLFPRLALPLKLSLQYQLQNVLLVIGRRCQLSAPIPGHSSRKVVIAKSATSTSAFSVTRQHMLSRMRAVTTIWLNVLKTRSTSDPFGITWNLFSTPIPLLVVLPSKLTDSLLTMFSQPSLLTLTLPSTRNKLSWASRITKMLFSLYTTHPFSFNSSGNVHIILYFQ